MSNRQYFHDIVRDTFYGEKYNGHTLSVEVPDKQYLLNILNQSINATLNPLFLKVGSARCSRQDNYCRKIGRDIADSRIKEEALSLFEVMIKEEEILFEVRNTDMTLLFKLRKGNEKVFFVRGFLYS